MLLQHRISPADLGMPFIFSPAKHHPQYFDYCLLDGPASTINISFMVHIDKRKIFEQVVDSNGDSSALESNHAVFLRPIVRDATHRSQESMIFFQT
jgi:hypothetical protein